MLQVAASVGGAAEVSSNAFWAARSKERYSEEQIRGSAGWLRLAAEDAPVLAPVSNVGIDDLNSGQRRIYDFVAAHSRARLADDSVAGVKILVCGTAGFVARVRKSMWQVARGGLLLNCQHAEDCRQHTMSERCTRSEALQPKLTLTGTGKTVLIKALEGLLSEQCVVLAPTGELDDALITVFVCVSWLCLRIVRASLVHRCCRAQQWRPYLPFSHSCAYEKGRQAGYTCERCSTEGGSRVLARSQLRHHRRDVDGWSSFSRTHRRTSSAGNGSRS